MKPVQTIHVTKFSRSDFICVSAFAWSSFLQAIVVTIQGPSYGSLLQFETNSNHTPTSTNIVPTFDIHTGTIVIPPSPISSVPENDFSATFFGIILAFYQIFSLILTPIVGIYVEGIGIKKTYMFGIYIVGASPFLSIFLSLFPPTSILYLILSFFIRGAEAVGSVGMQVAIYMMITILFPGRIATIFAVNQAMTVFGLALGGPIVFLIQKFGGFALPSTTFLTMGLVFCGFVYVINQILPNLPPRESLGISFKDLFQRYYEFLKVPSILLFQLSILFTGIGNAFLQSILAPNLQELNVGVWGVALLPLLPALLQLLCPIWGYALDHIPNGEVVALIGTVIASLSLVIIGPLPFVPIDQDLGLTCFGLVVFGLGQGAVVVSSYVLLIILAEENCIPSDIITTTVISSSYVAATSLGSGLSSILSGMFYDNYGFRMATVFPFSLYAGLTILVALYAILNHRSILTLLYHNEKSPLLTPTISEVRSNNFL